MQVLARLCWIGLLACLAIQVVAVEQDYNEAAERLTNLMRDAYNRVSDGLPALPTRGRSRREPRAQTSRPSVDAELQSGQASQGGGQDPVQRSQIHRGGRKKFSTDWDLAREEFLLFLQERAQTEEVQRLSHDEPLFHHAYLLTRHEDPNSRKGVGPEVLRSVRDRLVSEYVKGTPLHLAFQRADGVLNQAHWRRGARYAFAHALFPLAGDMLIDTSHNPPTRLPWHYELLHEAALEATSLDDDTLGRIVFAKEGLLRNRPGGLQYSNLRNIRRKLYELLTRDLPHDIPNEDALLRDELVQRFAKAYRRLVRDRYGQEPQLSRGLIERLVRVPPLHHQRMQKVETFVPEWIENVRLQEETGRTGSTEELKGEAAKDTAEEPPTAAHEAAPGSRPEAHPEHGAEGYGTGQGFNTDQAHQVVHYPGASTVAQHQNEPDDYRHAGQDHNVESAQINLNMPSTPRWSPNDVYRPHMPSPPRNYDMPQMPSPPRNYDDMPEVPNSPFNDVYRPEMPTSPAASHGQARSSRPMGGSGRDYERNRAASQDTVRIGSEPSSRRSSLMHARTETVRIDGEPASRMDSWSHASAQGQSVRPMETSRGQTQSMVDSLDAASRRPSRRVASGAVESMPMRSVRRSGTESGYLPGGSEMSANLPRKAKARTRLGEESSSSRRWHADGDSSSDEAESRFSAAPAYREYRGEGYGLHGHRPLHGPPPIAAYPPPMRWPPYPGATPHWPQPPPHYGGYQQDPSSYYPTRPEQPGDPNHPPPRAGYFSAQYGYPRPYPP